MNIRSDRRHDPRRTAFIPAEYTVKEGTFRDVIKNIGSVGLFIGTRRKIFVGQPILVQFPLFQFDHTIQVRGIVDSTEPEGLVVIFDEPIHGLTCKDGLVPEIIHEGDQSK